MAEIDIVTPLQAFGELDAESAARSVRPVIEAARQTIEASGGAVLEAGDAGLTAIFGARGASEVHAVMAARAALAARAAIDRASGRRARMRAALDTNEAIITQDARGLRASGAALRNARRLAHSLRRDTIALTDRTRASAGG